MISDDLFRRALAAVGRGPNAAQRQVLDAPQNAALFVVAGPGTGKTACLTMRMLKLIFTGGVSPRGILATTFTKKAAAELRSRILSWGYGVLEHLLTKEKLSKLARLWLERVDINQVRTGTIDGICEELLRDFRDPGADPPVLADKFVSRTLLMRHGLLNDRRDRDPDFERLLAGVDGKIKQDGSINTWGWHLGRKTEVTQGLWDRRFQDQMDWVSFFKGGSSPAERNARRILDLALADYDAELKNRLMVDFTQLEQTVLDRLQAGGLKDFTNELIVVLVDEYQDTNLLQESLYFQLAQRCNGALTVVGDDDQSLYRFRGATVELFRDFETRYMSFFKRRPRKVFLNENYRSSATIVQFVNAYATLDAGYQTVRVKGKPSLISPIGRAYELPDSRDVP